MQPALMTLMLFRLLVSSATAATVPSLKFSIDDPNLKDPQHEAGAGSANSQAPTALSKASMVQLAPLTGRQKFRFYLRSTYGSTSLAFSLTGSGINQARDAVPEWGQGMAGYGKRFASSFAQKAVDRSIWLGMGALWHEDPRYFASNRSGIWKRTLYAAGQTFVAHKDSGGTRFAYSRFVGAFSAAYISRQWYPDAYHTTSDYLSAGATSIGIGMAKKVFFEFWPDMKRMFHL